MNDSSRSALQIFLVSIVILAAIGLWWLSTPGFENQQPLPSAGDGSVAEPVERERSAPESTAESTAAGGEPSPPPADFAAVKESVTLPAEPVERQLKLAAGQSVEISCRIVQPSRLADNTRVRVSWELIEPDDPDRVPRAPAADSEPGRELGAFGIYTAPTANWSKVLHALDGDVYCIYRAPVSGLYSLRIAAEEAAITTFAGTRWREQGKVHELFQSPAAVAWPVGARAQVEFSLAPLDLSSESADLLVEAEPNDTPEQAQPIPLPQSLQPLKVHVVGGSDDVEYFDNGEVGASGDDWFRLEYRGSERRLLTACLSIPDQQVAARIRCYSVEAERAQVAAGQLLPIEEYTSGKNPNERGHQQAEAHRLAINRWLKPDAVYLLRVEANSPGYELELRVVDPAPFDDPRQAVRHGLYDHLGQVDSWLMNRPRGASVERRLRDTGNLLGTGCMSCHTQAGVWGPAVALANGYRPENVHLMRNLVNICYQSMRPTNTLVDAVNNASLAPLDLGDGPAGTRVAGHAACSYERYRPPRQLHSRQAIRAANNVLQTADPSGVNAAGPGANVGQGVVINYAGEVLWTAWKTTDDPVYFRALEDKARAVLEMNPKYTDDLCHRVELLSRYFPADYVAVCAEVAEAERQGANQTTRITYRSRPTTPEQAQELAERIRQQITTDIARLRAIQHDDGSWGFSPGKLAEDGASWQRPDDDGEPAPTALALIALQATGVPVDDPAVSRGVQALLQLQRPSGIWKGQSQTGFVASAYALQALSRYYPTEPPVYTRDEFTPQANESLVDSIRRARDLSATEEPALVPLMIGAAEHSSPLVRYWGMIGLGAVHQDNCLSPLLRGLSDPVKMVREAAHWGLRQVLIDDTGWDRVLAATQAEDDYAREAAMRALVMRVDGVLPEISVAWNDLGSTLSRTMNHDPHPAVRAWAARAAWNWWIWNPPLRSTINQAWVEMLCRPEPNALAENSLRYQTHALLVANGHHANPSKDHQYAELSDLVAALNRILEPTEATPAEVQNRLVDRLVSVASTFYDTSGGDGGPGQMGYATPGSGELFGMVMMHYFERLEAAEPDLQPVSLRVGLEGAARIPYEPLQQRLIHYSLHAPNELRTIAARSVSDPQSAKLVGVPEQIEPLIRQVHRGAEDAPRRPQLSEPILLLFRTVSWMVPPNREQQQQLLGYLIPDLREYYSSQDIEALADRGQQAAAERLMSANEYLAVELGRVLAENPDLHTDVALEAFPAQIENPLQARFWLPSVKWILNHKLPPAQVGATAELTADDQFAEVRQRALRLFLDQLNPEAELKTRQLAVQMAYTTVLRSKPEVHEKLRALLNYEKPTLKTMAQHVLNTNRERFVEDLVRELKREQPQRIPVDEDGEPSLSAEFIDDITFFRDFVTAEMNSPLRADGNSCFSCHGEPERVPSLELEKPNPQGYLSVRKLLSNYRLLQERINLEDADQSKLLRKPLNIQTGQEDGHQGGVRYRINDPGYEVLREWVQNQVAHRQFGQATAEEQ